MSALFPFFQSMGTFSDCHDFSNRMDSDLATTSASSLRTLGYISSGPMDLAYSGSSNGLKLDLLLKWVGLHLLSFCLEIQGLETVTKTNSQRKLRQRSCWRLQLSPWWLSPDHLCQLLERHNFFCLVFSDKHTCRSPFLFFFMLSKSLLDCLQLEFRFLLVYFCSFKDLSTVCNINVLNYTVNLYI